MFAFAFFVLAIQHPFCACSVTSVMSNSLRPLDCSPPSSSVHGILQARILDVFPCPPPEDLPDSGIEPVSLTSSALVGSSLPLAALHSLSLLKP